ncbi:hypothetical protein Pyrfu_0299 [Pyrolobus fumarii 1A]|uniref:Uncharacterized protein n=1 Tax=Pyrolobus fumarii (strain DSM 11204 / 1A) TaxID=694429 RepID=G0EFC8_PYRF1|nr:hypothetical protein [Pyrolobus fumarii]AEM38171.1 hypothetical protein Pyrfu_0299 [Pyrolobus fumarii 1A]
MSHETLRVLDAIIDEVAEKLRDRILSFRHLSLSEIAETVERIVCSEWGKIRPITELVEIGEECSTRVRSVEEYLGFLRSELKRVADRLVDLAMEALAKHVETLPDGVYARLSWLIVSFSSRVSHRIMKLLKLIEGRPEIAPLAEFLTILVSIRAVAFYRIVARMASSEVAKVLDAFEAFAAAVEVEEDTIIERLERGVYVLV